MRRKFSALMVAMLVLIYLLLPVDTALASPRVKVTLPTFKVTLNEVDIDNSYNQYPLIVYKDITYFPMTYYDCRFLGLESLWSSNRGLEIARSGVNWDYHKYPSSTKNGISYTATVANFKIKVNGKSIDNSQEVYPLLVFRNITYFPITWRFAADEFGWDYTFNNTDGLVIGTKGGNNAIAGQITLPIVTRESGSKGAFTVTNNYYYYEGEGGKIYQAPVANPSHATVVYQLPLNQFNGTNYVLAGLKTENGKAILSYHTGGATMGSDHYIGLQDDGTNEDLSYGFAYAYSKEFGAVSVLINHGVPPINHNLLIKEADEDFRRVGESDYLYGWTWTYTDNSSCGGRSHDLYMMGDDIYVLAYYQQENSGNTTGIYRVNTKTNQTTRVCDNPASTFTIDTHYIYFKDYYLESDENGQRWSLDGALYRVPLEGGTAAQLTDVRVSDYAVLNGQVYYVSMANNQLYMLGESEPINPGGIVKSLEVQDGYLVAIFDKSSTTSSKMMIINKNGKVVYQTIEDVLMARIDNGKVSYVKDV